MFVIVGHVFCHAWTCMTILGQNQDSHTCAIVEVFHDNTKIIITEVVFLCHGSAFVKANRHVASTVTVAVKLSGFGLDLITR